MLNEDFKELLSELSAAEAEFLVVGAYALAAHGLVRATGDLDIWVRPTEQNATRVRTALLRFGAPSEQFTLQDLQEPDLVIQIGLPPVRVDLLTGISGVSFDEAWPNRVSLSLGKLQVPVLGRDHLIKNKRATGRDQDIVDLKWLEGDSER